MLKSLILRLAAFLLFFSLPLAAPSPQAGEKRVLYIYSWEDYFDSNALDAFQRKFDCRIDITNFVSSSSLLDSQNALDDFDLITPSSYVSSALWEQGLLRELDHAKIPNLRHLDPTAPQLTEDPRMRYSIPYTRSICGIGYNKNLVREEDLDSWNIFANRRYAGRMTMIDDMRETIGAALKHLGYSLNTTDDRELDEAGQLLAAWRGNLSRLVDDSDRRAVNHDDRIVSHAYNGDVALMIDAGNNWIGFRVPPEGSSLVTDDFVIPAGAQNADLAHAFINHMLEPKTAKRNMETVYFYMFVPEAVAMLKDDLKANPAFNIPEEAVRQCEVIRDVGAHLSKYERVWRRVMNRE